MQRFDSFMEKKKKKEIEKIIFEEISLNFINFYVFV